MVIEPLVSPVRAVDPARTGPFRYPSPSCQEYVEELVERPRSLMSWKVDRVVSRTPAAAGHSGDGRVRPPRGDRAGSRPA
jgi:hypothetical protein